VRVWAGGQQAEPGAFYFTGVGALEESALSFLQGFVGREVTALKMPHRLPAAPGICGPDFAAVVGAALRELLFPYLSGRSLGVTDRLPMLQALAQKAYLAPVAVLLLSFAVLGGHYFLIVRQIESAKVELAVLEREREEVRGAVARMQEEEKRVTTLGEQRLLLAGQVDYLQNRLPQYGRLLHAVLAALDAEGGTAVRFVQIELLDRGGQFIVSGESTDSGSIHRLAVALQGEKWCAFAKVEEIVREVREEAAEDGLPEEEAFAPPPPEAGLLPGEEIPGIEAPVMEPDPAFAEAGEDLGEEALAEAAATVVFKFRTRVVVRPEFFPERPFEEKAPPEAATTGERAL